MTATGGTEVKWSPALVTYEQVKLPFCRQFGLDAAIERHRSGFYPAGGGSATLHLQPTTISAVHASERGDLVTARCFAVVSEDLTDSSVGVRQAESEREQLEQRGIPVRTEQIRRVETESTGSALAVELECEQSRAGFDALGERGVPAEKIATRAVDEAVALHEGGAAVDRHLADQLLVFLALAGGNVSISAVTDHVTSSCNLLEQSGFALDIDQSGTVPAISAPVP